MAGINAAVTKSPDFFQKVDVIVAPPMLHLAAVLKSINPAVKVGLALMHARELKRI